MKKYFIFALALSVLFGTGMGVSFADVQIDEGQAHGTAAVKYFIGRVASNQIVSKDRVVVFDQTSDDGVTVTMTTTSRDALVAGITMEAITGISSDSVASDLSRSNWGRVQTWGYHSGNVPKAVGSSQLAGDSLCAASLQGYVSPCSTTSMDKIAVASALDAEDGAANVTGIEVFVNAD